ncbi:uncharacterized protein EV420DRAFT_1645828 [Desarmillaria tabescens]|uniref:Uncharacterized protein n=1 Tax=Armillaria tabescens TaxID=1929756 RepID=A0AA39K4S6_ARMTA|nr:uncharacterized protein EV420DRAFT_1645828 [Desarmillaria tabescens]KAK0452188.1 hypothetical protein EV420DRAFT_1645828 [Desarmillaria tabescens]
MLLPSVYVLCKWLAVEIRQDFSVASSLLSHSSLSFQPYGLLKLRGDPPIADQLLSLIELANIELLISADISGMNMVLEWSVDIDACIKNCTTVNIFLNTNLPPSDLSYGGGPYNDKMPIDPIFMSNGSYIANNRIQLINATPYVPTELNVSSFTPLYRYAPGLKDYSCTGLVCYPFDRYYTQIPTSTEDASMNKSTSLAIIIRDFLSGLEIKMPMWWEDRVSVVLQRTTIVIAYCLVITITFWIITLMISLIMITTVVFGFRQRNEIIVVPIGTVFAFIQLRSSMPGAPAEFGCVLDIFGLLPCIVLLSISAIGMVGIYLFADPDDPSQKLSENALRYVILHIWNTSKDWVWRARFRIMIARQIWRAPYNFEMPVMNTAHESRA